MTSPDANFPLSRGISRHSVMQRLRVDGGADLRIVVEIGEDITTAVGGRSGIGVDQPRVVGLEPLGAQLDAGGPMVESLVRVAAGIGLLRAVQAQIDKIGGQVLGV